VAVAFFLACFGTLVVACSQSSSSETGDAASTGTGDAGALVAQCESLAATFVSNCMNEYIQDVYSPDTNRMCIWTAYGHMCRTGNTQLLVDSMNCFGTNPHCWTFSDPNDTAMCLANVHATGESAAAKSFLQQVCAQCGQPGCIPAGQAEFFPYVSDTELAAVNACRGTACTSADLLANCSSVPDVAAIFGCH
jgi:hypothetical protein